jgi:hypothetical protein
MRPKYVYSLISYTYKRIQERVRVRPDKANVSPTNFGKRLLIALEQIEVFEVHRPGQHVSRFCQQPEQAAQEQRLPSSRLSDQPDDHALAHIEVNVPQVWDNLVPRCDRDRDI